MRVGHLCPVAGCGHLRERWMAVCRSCWRRLPEDLRAAISRAKVEKARHAEAKAAIAATRWLSEHPPAAEAARRTGEG